MKTRIKNYIRPAVSALKSAGRQKIFCIGANKTGTTSLAAALRELNIPVAAQRPAELLIQDWIRRDFRRILRFCHTARAFQDIPFSLLYTFQALDGRFPGSKFILTIRDNPEQWYSSLIRFQSQLFGGQLPDYDDLKNATYCYPGWMLEVNRAHYSTPDDDLYNKEIMMNDYNFHNRSVMEYFRYRTRDLLVINLAENGSYAKLCKFLGKPCLRESFPWENRTADISVRFDLPEQ
ncbi:sulfotransferase [Candidatus Neomarinimicrobiota bacterium]